MALVMGKKEVLVEAGDAMNQRKSLEWRGLSPERVLGRTGGWDPKSHRALLAVGGCNLSARNLMVNPHSLLAWPVTVQNTGAVPGHSCRDPSNACDECSTV